MPMTIVTLESKDDPRVRKIVLEMALPLQECSARLLQSKSGRPAGSAATPPLETPMRRRRSAAPAEPVPPPCAPKLAARCEALGFRFDPAKVKARVKDEVLAGDLDDFDPAKKATAQVREAAERALEMAGWVRT